MFRIVKKVILEEPSIALKKKSEFLINVTSMINVANKIDMGTKKNLKLEKRPNPRILLVFKLLLSYAINVSA